MISIGPDGQRRVIPTDVTPGDVARIRRAARGRRGTARGKPQPQRPSTTDSDESTSDDAA